MTLVLNLVLFVLVYLPAVALFSMGFEAAFGDLSVAEPGTNPIFWLIYTAPWLFPLILLVPVLQFTAARVARNADARSARWVIVTGSQVLFGVALLVLWGPENFRPGFVIPALLAAFVYAWVLRIPVPRAEPEEAGP